MNQIIFSNDFNHSNETIINKDIISNSNKKNFKPYFYKLIFIFSNILSLSFLIYFILFNYNLNKKEELSKKLYNNFELKTLYSTNQDYSTNLDINNYVIGIIEIKSIDISYPIISECTDENLNISPCKFFGPEPNEIGNLCIVAHNYNNSKFFSQINKLSFGNIISIYDLNGKKIDYYVYDKFEINYDELECTSQNTNGYREITLITCNNIEKNRRVVIKAKERMAS